jgi:hypothetical protein
MKSLVKRFKAYQQAGRKRKERVNIIEVYYIYVLG